MILLEPKDYYKVMPALEQVEINQLFARAVVESKIDGFVYADELAHPTSFYVKHPYGMALLFGDAGNNAFNQQLKSYLLNEEGQRQKAEWLQAFPDEWNARLGMLLGDDLQAVPAPGQTPLADDTFCITKYTRVNFRFNPQKYIPVKPGRKAGLVLKKTENDSFRAMKGSVIPSNFWPGENEFLRHGVGFSLFLNGELVSTAFSAFVHGHLLELGIETVSGFHGKGFAQLTCSALIDYCLENNLEPVWACRLENTGSYKLAQKLGFEVERLLPYYQLPFEYFNEKCFN